VQISAIPRLALRFKTFYAASATNQKRANSECPRLGVKSAASRDVSNESRFVYVLISARDPQRHYVGLTSNVATRLAVHNSGGSLYTAQYRPWRLIVSLEFASQASALAFEQYLKTGSGRAFAKKHFI
jgi:predicted GIY-YIG superfamily endonuclease